MPYNHKKFTKQAEDAPEQYEGQLNEYNKDLGETKGDSPESVQGLLRGSRGEGQGENLDVVTDAQMNGERDETPTETVEAQFDKRKSYQTHRSDDNQDAPMMPINALSEGYDQKRQKAFNKRQSSLPSEKRIVDKDIGKQMSGERTKQPKQVPDKGTQLNNHPDRLASTDASKMMVSAMKDADAVLLYVHYKAASEGRDLNAKEKMICNQVNEDKKKILLSYYGGELENSQFDPMGNPLDPMGGGAADPLDDAPVADGGIVDEMQDDADGVIPGDAPGLTEDQIIDSMTDDVAVVGDDALGVSDMDAIDMGEPDFDNIHHQEQQDIADGNELLPNEEPDYDRNWL